MAAHDVCNGDADGLFALIQWRLAYPGSARLVTGLKHDIELLGRVLAAPGDEVNVFDLSMARNHDALQSLLSRGVLVRYFDHHHSGEIPRHPNLQAHIDTSALVCTSVLVDRVLDGRHRAWAIAAAYGDNLVPTAEHLAECSGVSVEARGRLRELGEAVNYNAYGESAADVLIHPAELYATLSCHADPLDLGADGAIIAELTARSRADLALAEAAQPVHESHRTRAFLLGDAPWTRRVVGPWANRLSRRDPARAHAVARARADGMITVSIRAPLANREGADRLARRFGGSGRAASAAIDGLPPDQWSLLVAALEAMDWGGPNMSERAGK